MEDNQGGLSVADLVQRHTGVRPIPSLPPSVPPSPPPPQQQSGRRALPPGPAPRRDGAPNGHHNGEPLDRPAGPPPAEPPRGGRAPGRRPGEATGGPQAWTEQPGGPRPGRQPSGPVPTERPAGRPQAGPLPGGRESASPPPASRRRDPRPPASPPPPVDQAGAPLRPSPGQRPAGQGSGPSRRLPADGDFRRHPGPADDFPGGPPPRRETGEFPGGPPQRHPGPGADDFPSSPPLRRETGEFPSGPPQRHPGPGADDFQSNPPPRRETGEFPSGPPQRHPGPGADDFPSNPPPRRETGEFPSGPPPRRPGRPGADDFPSGPQQRHPSVDDFPSNPQARRPGPPPGGPEADLPPGARESGIRRALNGEEIPGPGQRSMPARPPGQNTGHSPVPLPPPRPSGEEAISMTTEMEAIGDEVQKRRSIDHTLARFSAVHDELQAEEREKKSKRRKLPWQQQDEEMDRLDELVSNQTIAVPQDAPPAEDEPAARLKGRKARRREKSLRAGRAFAVVAATLIFLGTGFGWGVKAWINSSTQQVDALDPNSNAIQDADAQRGDENFLLVGSDTRAGAKEGDGVGSESDIVGARSDTVMIAHVPKSRERVVVVSFPRDLEVDRPACERWNAKTGEYTGETDPGEDVVKINTAYQVGGPKCVTKMVQQISGLAINHFIGIDFHGFKEMVDAVDGVQVCVERPLNDEVLGTIVPKAGKDVTLTGDQALNFVRARSVEGDPTADYGRIIRQQRFLSSLLRKAMSSEVLLEPSKLTGFVNAFAKSTFGDNIDVDTLFVLGQSLQGVEAGRVTFITVPTVGEANDNGNEDLRVEDTDALFGAIRNDTPLPDEAPAKGEQGKVPPNAQLTASSRHLLRQEPPATPVDPKTVKIQVLNGGNEQAGIARITGDELAELGYQVVWTDTSPEQVDRTVIKYSKVKQAQAQTLAASVPGAELVEDPAAGGALQLIIGPDFDGEVVSPDGGAPPAELPDLSTVNAGDESCA
ncbi:hypothetical protein GCM10027436_09620 [Actinophytocola sediminis]